MSVKVKPKTSTLPLEWIPTIQKWEYIVINGFQSTDELNCFGAEGWELIKIIENRYMSGINYYFYFKRPKS